jgi:hypothetical protein
MAKPEYDVFVQQESNEVAAVYRNEHGHPPGASDLYHNAWRRLEERWTHRDILHDILGEPLEDGGAGGDLPSVPPVEPLPPSLAPVVSQNDRHFLFNGHPTRIRSFSAFPLIDRVLRGHDVLPWLQLFREQKYNTARVWLYTPRKYWGDTAWDLPSLGQTVEAMQWLSRNTGLAFEVTLTTDDREDGYSLIRNYSNVLNGMKNVFFELINEAGIKEKLDPLVACEYVIPGDRPWANGMYEDMYKVRGTYGVAHDPRDAEWPRKSKGQIERWWGGGPNAPTDPAMRMPWICDEPGKPGESVDFQAASDFEAYFGLASQMSAGACFHSNAGKYLSPLSALELECMRAAAKGMNAFSDDLFDPNGYKHGTEEKNDEVAHGTLRTYGMRNTRVRVRPKDSAPILSFT